MNCYSFHIRNKARAGAGTPKTKEAIFQISKIKKMKLIV